MRFLLISIGLFSVAHAQNIPIPFPEVNGKPEVQRIDSGGSKTREEYYKVAKLWMVEKFVDAKEVI